MSDKSEIQWTDATWNVTTGCTKVSPECARCYIERTPPFRMQGRKFVKGHIPLLFHEDRLTLPLTWKRPRRIFVDSLSDLFHRDVPDDYLHRVYHTMEAAHWHTFQVLTKRAERMRNYLNWRYGAREDCGSRIPSRHIWHGVSVGVRSMRGRLDALRAARSAVRFVSFEPLLQDLGELNLAGFDWAILGGESGPRSRACWPVWMREIRAQCEAQGVAVFVKQLGAHVRDRNDAGFEGDRETSWPMDTDARDNPDGFRDEYQGAPVRVKLVDRAGGEMSEWPLDLRVRQFPVARAARGAGPPCRVTGRRAHVFR